MPRVRSVRNYGANIWHTRVGHLQTGMEWIPVIMVSDNRCLAYMEQTFFKEKIHKNFPRYRLLTPVDNEFSTSIEWF
jgi:molybdopterin synthase catalytic subunit